MLSHLKSRNLIAFILACGLLSVMFIFHAEQQADTVEKNSNSSARKCLGLVDRSIKEPALRSVARGCLEDLRQRDDKDPVMLFGLGWISQLQGANAAAEKYYAGTIKELAELEQFTHYNLSFIKEQRGDISGALEQVRAAIRVSPDFKLAQDRAKVLEDAANAPK